jgi:nucleoside 2-deoxyribosyltransferase
LAEKARRLLLNLFREIGPEPGSHLMFEQDTNNNGIRPKYFAKTLAGAKKLLDYIKQNDWIDFDYNRIAPKPIPISLTYNGHEKVHEFLREPIIDLKTVFIAMQFRNEPLGKRDALIAAIKACGYEKCIIDEYEHVNRISNEIEAQIRSARFMVADLSENNRGVYYEAGFALGHGIPVIWCVQDIDVKVDGKTKKAIETIHFDTRDYNFIIWKDLEDLETRLANRIRALNF